MDIKDIFKDWASKGPSSKEPVLHTDRFREDAEAAMNALIKKYKITGIVMLAYEDDTDEQRSVVKIAPSGNSFETMGVLEQAYRSFTDRK